MASLSIRLLGPFEVSLHDQPATQFESDKVRALLAYLVSKAEQPHRRETLAALLWPEMPDNAARANLRYALANLRTAIGDRQASPPFLHTSRQTIQFNRTSDAWADVWTFTGVLGKDHIRERTVQELEDAVGLARGEFLEGFGLRDSLPFEEWLLLQREHLARLRLAALHRLTAYHQAQAAYQPALQYAWQQVALEPYEELAQQQLMHLLAITGQRSAALAQYETLRTLLRDELGADPTPETRLLHRRILSGEIAPVEEALRDRIIRGYDLLEQVGAGTFGAVFRARQPVLGREVAIKVILPQYANRPDFVRRFEAEAQIVARLEHLHIVPLYDFWREPDGAFLVMRLFPSGSLKDSLARGPWGVSDAVRAVDQLASALTAAHAQGVIHRDVKPANILLDDVGNVYLSDFSIARDIAALSVPYSRLGQGESPGTGTSDASLEALTVSPEYAAPEQWQGVPLTPAVDVYSLGMVLYEMLAGTHPFAGIPGDQLQDKHLCGSLPALRTSHPQFGSGIEGVLGRATAKSPRDRYPDVAALAQAFHEAAERAAGRPVPLIEVSRPEPQNPYKGLRPFQEADAQHFFGRDTVTGHLLERLGGEEDALSRFLAIVGPSGSGKSSLVRAGLIPALRGGALPGSQDWFVVTMQPGTSPLEELAAGLRGVAVREVSGLQELLRAEGPHPEEGLLRAAQMVLPERFAALRQDDGTAPDPSEARDCELLLVVDQFEEFYAPGIDASERERFWQMLFAAVTDSRSRVRIVITLRADFYDQPLMHPLLSQLLKRRTEVVVPLTGDELEEAILGPARRAGVDLEPGLSGAIVADVAEEPGALPMFQYALTELFERRSGRLLTWEAYQSIGGVSGALARSAEAVFAGLAEPIQATARQVFLRLVTPGEGVEDTRRRVQLHELMAIQRSESPSGISEGHHATALDSILDVFGRARLLLFDRDPMTRAPTVEVAHEALLRAWSRLRAWLEESWSDVRMARLLGAATEEWLEARRDPGFLLVGTRLAQFEGWAAESTVSLTHDEEVFLEASVSARKEREAEREAQRQRELEAARALAGEQKRRAEAEQRRAEGEAEAARRLRRRAMYLAGALLAALALAVVAVMFGQRAGENANMAATRQAEAEAEMRLRATAQAGAELAAWLRATAQAEAETEAQLRATSQVAAEAEARLRSTAQVEAEREAQLRATAQAEAIRERDIAEEQSRISLSRELAAAAFNVLEADPELSTLLALRALEEAETSEVTYVLHQSIPALRLVQSFTGHSGAIAGLAVSPDGRLLATASEDGTVRLWGLVSEEDAGYPGAAVLGAEVLALEHPSGSTCVAFHPDGTLLAAGFSDGTLRVWQLSAEDAPTGLEIYAIGAHSEAVADAAFSPDGELIATGAGDALVRIWKSASGEEILVLSGHKHGIVRSRPWLTGITDLDFSLDGTRLATAGADGTVRVWDLAARLDAAAGLEGAGASREDRLLVVGQPGAAYGVSFNPEGDRVATVTERTRTRIWDISPGTEQAQTRVFIGQLGESVAFCPDGACLAIAGPDGVVRLYESQDGEELFALPVHLGGWALSFSPDGSRLVSAGADGVAKLWDTTPSREVLNLFGTGNGVAFDAEGQTLATGTRDGAILWHLEPPAEDRGREAAMSIPQWRTRLTVSGHGGVVNSIALSPAAEYLATASNDGTVKVWDAVSGEERLSLEADTDRVWDVAFSADAAFVAAGCADGSAGMWHIASGREVLRLVGHAEAVYAVSFHPDQAWLATAGKDDTTRIWGVSALHGEDTSAPLEIDAGDELFLYSHGADVFDVAFSPDGTRLGATDADGTTTVWDITPLFPGGPGQSSAAGSREAPDSGVPRLLFTLDGHTQGVTRIAYSADGSRIATASYDTTARVWDSTTGQEIAVLSLSDDALTGIAFSPDGRYLATTGGGVTRFYALQTETLVALARERLTRELADQECQRYLHLSECLSVP